MLTKGWILAVVCGVFLIALSRSAAASCQMRYRRGVENVGGGWEKTVMVMAEEWCLPGNYGGVY